MDVRRETTGEYEREAMTNIVDAKDLMHEYVRRDEEGNIEETLMALDHLNLTVKPGKFIAVLGHNGSGKSTFAKHVNALLEPTGGSLWVNGMDVTDEENIFAIRQSAGMVFQNPDNQIIASVVQEDVGFGPENIGVPTDEIWERVEKSLKAVGMWEYREHSPNKLSGGQKQRVAIAGVMAMEPKCIVLDEPTAMLDPRGRSEVMRTIRKLNEQFGITSVLITHYMDEAARCDRVVVMDDGKILMDGVPREVFSQVERLKSVGLDVPAATELIYHLRQKGYQLRQDVIFEDECAEELARFLKEQNVDADH